MVFPTHLENFSDSKNLQTFRVSNPYNTLLATSAELLTENVNSAHVHQHDNAQYNYFQIPSQTNSFTQQYENAYYKLHTSNQQCPIHQHMFPHLPVHPNKFFYQPPNDLFNYHIKCERVSKQLLNRPINIQLKGNEYVFFYQQLNDYQCYQITCEVFSTSSFNIYLNSNIYGIEIMGQEEFSIFTHYHKENLKFYLTQYLSHHLLN
jgi:hypothetical protein